MIHATCIDLLISIYRQHGRTAYQWGVRVGGRYWLPNTRELCNIAQYQLNIFKKLKNNLIQSLKPSHWSTGGTLRFR